MESQTSPSSPLAIPSISVVSATKQSLAQAEAALSEAERRVFSRFTVPKRRRDWLMGRLAAKLALAQASPFPINWREFVITTLENGRPGVIGPKDAWLEWCVSLTHSGGHAVAIAAPYPIGIDLEGLRELNPATHRFFLQPAEEAAIATGAWGTNGLVAAWTVKESVYKLLGGVEGGLRALRIAHLHPGPVTVHHPLGQAVAHVCCKGSWGLALAHPETVPLGADILQDRLVRVLCQIEAGAHGV